MYRKVIESYVGSDSETINKVKQGLNTSGKPVMNYSDIKDSIIYEASKNKTRYRIDNHCGQRKLFMCELRFLNEETNGTGLVIYAGGSPGNHLYELSLYYPDIRYIIIDPSGFQPYVSAGIHFNATRYKRNWTYDDRVLNITDNINLLADAWPTSARLFYIGSLCTTELILDILKLVEPHVVDYYLWSDIRTGEGESGIFGFEGGNKLSGQNIKDIDIYQNLALQYTWVRDTKPKSSMVKFRAPFYDDGETELHDDEFIKQAPELCMVEGYPRHEFKYPDGQIYLQPWVGKSSTESRMVIRSGMDLITFNAYEYDNRFNYYNLVERPLRKHNVGVMVYEFGYCECNDCAIELETLKDYVRKNKVYIRDLFQIGAKLYTKKIVCKLGFRLSVILGNFILEKNNHGINRY